MKRKCDYCDLEFDNIKTYASHVKYKHMDMKESYKKIKAYILNRVLDGFEKNFHEKLIKSNP